MQTDELTALFKNDRLRRHVALYYSQYDNNGKECDPLTRTALYSKYMDDTSMTDAKIQDLINKNLEFLLSDSSIEEAVDTIMIDLDHCWLEEEILAFINNFKISSGNVLAAKDLFGQGYCWHFAHLLKTTFDGDGDVCWCAPDNHFVWVYEDTAYDIDGISTFECDHYIPEEYLCGMECAFKHRAIDFNIVDDGEKAEIIERYLKDMNDF